MDIPQNLITLIVELSIIPRTKIDHIEEACQLSVWPANIGIISPCA